MQISGPQIISHALEVLLVHKPGDILHQELLDQARSFGTMKLEELALRGRFIPGVTIVNHTLEAGKNSYTVGPGAESDIQTDSTPERVERWSLVEGDREIPMTATADASVWQMRSSAVGGRPDLLYAPGVESDEISRPLLFSPNPDGDYRVRLYLLVPSITNLSADGVDYDLPRGMAQVLILQIAAAMIPVYALPGEQADRIERRADLALDVLEDRNARYQTRPTRISKRWLGSISNPFHIANRDYDPYG